MMIDYDASYDLQCPACKTTKYRNPQMKLMVNVCGHALCESCVNLYFIKESGQCPECDLVLKRSKFRVQIFEDPMVEKEIGIRRKVLRIYNKQEDDFSIVEEWDRYLEEIEEIVYNLTYEHEKGETEKRLEAYEKLHKDDIKKNYMKLSKEEEELRRLCEEERIRQVEREKTSAEEEKLIIAAKQKNKSSLLQDLMLSDGDASLIVQSHAERLKVEQMRFEEELLKKQVKAKTSRMTYSTGLQIGAPGSISQKSIEIGPSYKYISPELPSYLPSPSWKDVERMGYISHVRHAPASSVAGGYTEHYACLRALQEFMGGHLILS